MLGKFQIATFFLAWLVVNGQQYEKLICKDVDTIGCKCTSISDSDSTYKIDCSDTSLNTTWITPWNMSWTYVEISFAGSKLTKLVKDHLCLVYQQEHLKQYNFANNQIAEIEEHAFDKCTALKTLNLSKNKLTSIDSEWFQGLWAYLEDLNLHDNQISTISDRAFTHLNNLRYLNLDNNPITKLTDQTFYGLSKLEVLSLDGTQIAEIDSSIFTSKTTPSLETLSVQRSKMEHLPKLKDLKYLKQVDFNRNEFIEAVHTKQFADVPSVTNISLDYMKKLKVIEDCAFCGLTDLKFILISDSPKLTEIPESAFDIGLAYGTVLDVVDFSNNSLKTLHPKMFPWKSIKTINLAGNRWNCSCDIAWMTHPAVIIKDSPKCFSPPELASYEIRNVTKNQFDCKTRTSYRTPRIFIAMTIMLVISGGVLITWYIWSSRKTEGGMSLIFKTNPLVKQPYAYRNLAMHQEDGEQIVQNKALDPDEEDDAPYPPFDKEHNNKAALV